MSKENKLIPKLRFPEFENEGEWDVKELNELGGLINGLTYSPDDVRNTGLLVLRSSNIQNGRIELNDCVYVRENIKGANLTEQKDILVCVRNGSKNLIGKNAIIPKGLPLATHGAFMTVFRAINPEFAFQLFQTDYYDSQVQADLGATINSINGKNFLRYEFPVPKNPNEQHRIASCLSSLDEIISAHTKKLGILKDHKKGLMQNLFPQESETVPKYRFKEFEKDGKWVEKKLRDMTNKVGSGVTPLGGESNYKKTGHPFVRSQNVGWGVLLLDNIAFIDEKTHQKSINSEIKFEDVLLNITGASIGRSAVATEFVSGGNVNQHVCIINTRQNILNPYFLNQFLISDLGQRQIDSFQAGGNRQGLNFVQIRTLSIPIPPTIQEQQKIAFCLSSLDALIAAQVEKIEQLKLLKKGLMQGLFPNSITN